jgi:hypothetical protein
MPIPTVEERLTCIGHALAITTIIDTDRINADALEAITECAWRAKEHLRAVQSALSFEVTSLPAPEGAK